MSGPTSTRPALGMKNRQNQTSCASRPQPKRTGDASADTERARREQKIVAISIACSCTFSRCSPANRGGEQLLNDRPRCTLRGKESCTHIAFYRSHRPASHLGKVPERTRSR